MVRLYHLEETCLYLNCIKLAADLPTDVLKSVIVNYFLNLRLELPDFLVFYKCIIQKIKI